MRVPRSERQLWRDGMHAQPKPVSERVVAFPRSRLSDAELVLAVARGDHDALSAVWTRYVADVRNMIETPGRQALEAHFANLTHAQPNHDHRESDQ